ncbi:MAG: GlsB/YeaQ/YmgE family stress response membrane protein [Dehalococcoidia bacterium]|nr:GlsB/YeaQ/YmgE family stress response membrane protein [Dehalococcoidia bacterium]
MGILAWLVLGLIAGVVAKLIVGGPDAGGCSGIIVTIVIGLVGAVVGGFIGVQLGWGTVNELDLRSIGLAVLGSVVVLLVLEAIRGR